MSKALRSRRPKMPPLHTTRGLVHSTQDKADALADSLELQCRPYLQDVDEEHALNVERTVRRFLRLSAHRSSTACSFGTCRKFHAPHWPSMQMTRRSSAQVGTPASS
ncbi:hypothetical protein RI129_009449 [Pyrocoelia pectoralis]|uniref:Uncharacterized protein n=1 Tax=Pyrocoelia pectoralis TaxID=417401 RepID=A0AAN7V4N4_9COLE